MIDWYIEPEIDGVVDKTTVFSYLDAVREGELMYYMDDTAFSLSDIIAEKFDLSYNEGNKLYWEWLDGMR